MAIIVAATSSGFANIRKRIEERRSMLEKRQNARVKRVKHDLTRIKQDIDRIAKREVEYSKSLVDDLVPFNVVWNDEVVRKMSALAPFTIEEKDKQTGTRSNEAFKDILDAHDASEEYLS